MINEAKEIPEFLEGVDIYIGVDALEDWFAQMKSMLGDNTRGFEMLDGVLSDHAIAIDNIFFQLFKSIV
jgi:hypothetical protein